MSVRRGALLGALSFAFAATAEATENAAEPSTRAVEPSPADVLRVTRDAPYRPGERRRDRGRVRAASDDEELARWNLGGSSDPSHPSNREGYHPGTRVRVDVDIRGAQLPVRARLDRRTGRRAAGLTQAGLLAQARRAGYWPFRLCFEEARHRDPKLRGGRIEGELLVDAEGRTKHRRHGPRRGLSDGVAECVATGWERVRFARPPRAVLVPYAVQLWPGDAPLPPVGLPDGAVVAPGTLPAAAVEAVLERLELPATACFAAARAEDPSVWGRAALQVHVRADGRVERAREVESQFPSRAAVGCLRGLLAGVQFPRPDGGPADLVVSWRLHPPAPAADRPGVPAAPPGQGSTREEPRLPGGLAGRLGCGKVRPRGA